MKRIAWGVLLACGVFALLIWGSVLVGRAQERPEVFEYLGKCAGTPCYLGIVPGETRWSDIQSQFEIVTDLRGETEIYLAYAPPGFLGALRFYPSGDGLLRQVDLRFHTTQMKLGSLIAEMGSPCAVGMTNRGLPVVIYSGMGVLIAGERIGEMQLLKPTSTVTGINLLRDPSCDLTNSLALYGWQGFGRYVS
jgi:hypothetical protein